MRDNLKQYVELLFAGAADTEDIKQEILQNTLDRYDDLISQGKSAEAAYRLAISGIGDINEILGNNSPAPAVVPPHTAGRDIDEMQIRKMQAVAIAMYILCPVPLFIFNELGIQTLGLCMMFLLVAAATALLIMANKHDDDEKSDHRTRRNPGPADADSNLKKIISTVTTVLYFALSFLTGAWHVTWLIFLIKKCVFQLIDAIHDYKEASDYEA